MLTFALVAAVVALASAGCPNPPTNDTVSLKDVSLNTRHDNADFALDLTLAVWQYAGVWYEIADNDQFRNQREKGA